MCVPSMHSIPSRLRFFAAGFVGLLLAGAISAQARQPQNVVSFDLRYTLRRDLRDPAQVAGLWDDLHAAATLQGVVNRERPRLYLHYVVEGGCDIDAYWWNHYTAPGGWLHGVSAASVPDMAALVEAFRDDIRGVVLYDSNVAATSNVASAVAGIEALMAVRYDPSPGSLYRRVVESGPKLPVRVRLVGEGGAALFTGRGIIPGTERASSGSVKADPYLWFIERYVKAGRCNMRYAGYYIDQKWREAPRSGPPNHHTLTNHDFFVSRRGFFFDLSPWADEPATDDRAQAPGTDRAVLEEFLREAYRANRGEAFCYIGGFPAWAYKYTQRAGGKHPDVATEWEFGRVISAYNAFKDADAIGYGALANASFWQHFPLRDRYPQRWVTTEELRRRGLLAADGSVTVSGRNFILFYVGDYDASSWIAQRTHDIWDHPDRGKVPLMWCISPVLQERVPMVLHYLRETAGPNDYFAAADNGAGYLLPGMLQAPRALSGLPDGLDAWARHCDGYYRRWGLSVTGFVIDGEAPPLSVRGLDCYASFSPNGIVPQKAPLTLLHGDMPVLRSDEDIQQNPREAARRIVERVTARRVPFHWFRNILKNPGWYRETMEELHRLDPRIELLDAPAFFELYRRWLREKKP